MQRPAPRLTVGPLPSSVYWRRRAIVLAVVVVAAVLVWLAVRGGSPSSPTSASSQSATMTSSTPATTRAAPTEATPTPGEFTSPSFTPDQTGPSATPRSPAPANVAPCTDDQITVTVAASPSPGLVGGTFTFSIAIASKATDWCSRDLGAGAQEIRVLRDGELLYSSDECGGGKTSDVRSFAAGDAVMYRHAWSSYRATPHNCAPAANPAPPGKYQVVARIGTKLSAPVDFIINR
ncbi:hypothetical protein AB0M46_50115 [Dactylosporangium sp. NPDC051485]|uniref:hypothetical protein n=1 Tax=Dactylosporangium sp. NPDC051485 TaxID=3154846 RepID=UPI00343ABECB